MRPSTPRRLLAVFALSLASLAAATPADKPISPAWPLLGQYAGKVVLVDFWASWCGPCLRSFPWMNELQQRHAGEGLVIVAVNLDQDRARHAGFRDALRTEREQQIQQLLKETPP